MFCFLHSNLFGDVTFFFVKNKGEWGDWRVGRSRRKACNLDFVLFLEVRMLLGNGLINRGDY